MVGWWFVLTIRAYFTLQALGRNGRVVKIDGDGDIRVKIDDKTWIFSPVVVSPVDENSLKVSVPKLTDDDKESDSDFSSSTSSMNGNSIVKGICTCIIIYWKLPNKYRSLF